MLTWSLNLQYMVKIYNKKLQYLVKNNLKMQKLALVSKKMAAAQNILQKVIYIGFHQIRAFCTGRLDKVEHNFQKTSKNTKKLLFFFYWNLFQMNLNDISRRQEISPSDIFWFMRYVKNQTARSKFNLTSTLGNFNFLKNFKDTCKLISE